MSAPLPDALRTRFHRLIEEGLIGRAAAWRLKVSPATGARWRFAIRRTGTARAAPQGRAKDKGKLDPHRTFFAEIIAQEVDITMPETAAALFDATGVRAHSDPAFPEVANHPNHDSAVASRCQCLGHYSSEQ